MKTLAWGAETLGWFNSATAEQLALALQSNAITGLALDRGCLDGQGLPEAIFSFPRFDALVLTEPNRTDLSQLPRLPHLRLLSVGEGSRSPVDLTRLPELEDLSVCPQSADTLPLAESPLRRLVLRKYRPASKSLADLPSYTALHELELIQCRVQSLAGLNRMVQLRSLGLFNCAELEGADPAFIPKSLTSIHLDSCKRFTDLEALASLDQLVKIVLANMPPLRSLSFLRSFDRLEEFRFVKTDVEDGDLKPLLQLKRVGFLDRKKFNLTLSEVNKQISLS